MANYDLTDLQPGLGLASTLTDLVPAASASVMAILSADVLVVGSPVCKGSYTGLFKHLFDPVNSAALAGKLVVLTATGGGEKHVLVIEHQLRPLFNFFEAVTAPAGIDASAVDFIEGQPASPVLLSRIDRAVDQLSTVFGQRLTAAA